MASLLSYKGNILTNKEGKTYTSSGIVKHVDSFPKNPEENVIYKLKGYSSVNVLIVYNEVDEYVVNDIYTIVSEVGATPYIEYSVVDDFPEEPNASDIATLSAIYCYICNDIPYLYCDVGYGLMWIDFATVYNSLAASMGIYSSYENKGYTTSNDLEFSPTGVYVTYKKDIGVKIEQKANLVNLTHGYADYEGVFKKTVEKFYDDSIKVLPYMVLNECQFLIEINCPNVLRIERDAISNCRLLQTLRFAKCIDMEKFFTDAYPDDIYFGSEQVVNLRISGYNTSKQCIIHVRPELVSQYEIATNWSSLIADGTILIVGDYTDE